VPIPPPAIAIVAGSAGNSISSASSDRVTSVGVPNTVVVLRNETVPRRVSICRGAYDRDDVYREVCERHPDAAVIVPPRSSAVPSATAENAPTKRDRHLQLIAERGRMGWQRASGYNWRALVEADIGRYKRVIGDALRSRTKGRQMTEVAIAVASLNRMLELGRPGYLRLS
jgi:hypothetical protein